MRRAGTSNRLDGGGGSGAESQPCAGQQRRVQKLTACGSVHGIQDSGAKNGRAMKASILEVGYNKRGSEPEVSAIAFPPSRTLPARCSFEDLQDSRGFQYTLGDIVRGG